ncbi:MAG: hypothetical protein SWK76_08085 [Actinomycetota bacterium]|nr:hypothetical protein [Actinomycetota bacterium]
MGIIESLQHFIRSANFRTLCLVSLIGYGMHIGLTVTMEKIISYQGFTPSFASYVAAVITVGGIVGAAILPGLSEKVGLRKPFLIIAASVPIPMILLIAHISNKPLSLAGSAVGTLMAVGSIVSVFIPVIMELLKMGNEERPDYRVALLFLMAMAVVGLIVVILKVEETGPCNKGD